MVQQTVRAGLITVSFCSIRNCISDLIVIYRNQVVYVHEEGANNEMKGETNAWLKHGDTLVKRGDT